MNDQSSIRRQIVDLIVKYEAHLEFSTALHPTNSAEQKEKFLAGDVDNPSFEYRSVNTSEIDLPVIDASDEIEQLYLDRINHTKAQGALLQAIGDDEQFTEQSKLAFPLSDIPNTEFKLDESSNSSEINTAQIVDAFQQALDECELSDWTIKVQKDMSARMFVNQWTKVIGIRDGLLLSQVELDGLIRHEIGVHVLRSVSGQKQDEPILHVGTKKGRHFEEGIACYMEDPSGPSRIFLRHHAVTFAQSHSFRETWEELREVGVTDDDAWSMTLRVKRGLKDASNHGGFTRDALYAQAFVEMKNYASTGGKVEPLLSAPIHPSEINLLVEKAGMEVFPLPGILST